MRPPHQPFTPPGCGPILRSPRPLHLLPDARGNEAAKHVWAEHHPTPERASAHVRRATNRTRRRKDIGTPSNTTRGGGGGRECGRRERHAAVAAAEAGATRGGVREKTPSKRKGICKQHRLTRKQQRLDAAAAGVSRIPPRPPSHRDTREGARGGGVPAARDRERVSTGNRGGKGVAVAGSAPSRLMACHCCGKSPRGEGGGGHARLADEEANDKWRGAATGSGARGGGQPGKAKGKRVRATRPGSTTNSNSATGGEHQTSCALASARTCRRVCVCVSAKEAAGASTRIPDTSAKHAAVPVTVHTCTRVDALPPRKVGHDATSKRTEEGEREKQKKRRI